MVDMNPVSDVLDPLPKQNVVYWSIPQTAVNV